jgi:hypothetical protein
MMGECTGHKRAKSHSPSNQENDIREQIRELAIQALALQQEIRAHVEALNKSINFE